MAAPQPRSVAPETRSSPHGGRTEAVTVQPEPDSVPTAACGVPPRHVSIGRLDSGYGPVLAQVVKDLLSSGLAVLPRPALIGHTASIPVVHVLEKFTRWDPVYAFDPRVEHADYQRARIRDARRVRVLQCSAEMLPAEVRDIAIAVNPFGLQEFPGKDGIYARAARARAAEDAVLITMDWGTTRYPDSVADLPGIRDEIVFSERSQLKPFTPADGWQLRAETVYEFFFVHTGEQVAAILPAAKAADFRASVAPDSVIEITSSVTARHYAATAIAEDS